MRSWLPAFLGLFALTAVPRPATAAPPARHAPAEVAAAIDRDLDRALAEHRIPASPPGDDAEFLRRAYLDLVGFVPPVDRVGPFLDSKDPDKRAKLVDELLASPFYGRHFGTLWHNRIVPLNPENNREFNKALFLWLANGFNGGRPWPQTVGELLLASGDREKNPALGFYFSPLNSVEGIVQPDRVAGSTAQLFLGVNLRCAQCHNHPFAPWKQTDFWGVAAFFGRVGFTKESGQKQLVESKAVLTKDNQPAPFAKLDGAIEIPGKGKVVKARFLGGDEPVLNPEQPARPVFVSWLTAPDNERFHEAAVNRLWAHFFARGLVTPVDDLHEKNPPSHPAVMKLLADEFAASGGDQKHLIRCLMLSRAYQRTSRPLPDNRDDDRWYSHARMKLMSPEAMYDSLAMVMDGRAVDTDLLKSVTNPGRDHWLWSFASQEAGEDVTRYTHGVPQALKMFNSQLTNATPPLLRQLCQPGVPWEQGLEKLYLCALARRPSEEEVRLFAAHRQQSRNAEEFYRDALWALVNGTEFVFNH